MVNRAAQQLTVKEREKEKTFAVWLISNKPNEIPKVLLLTYILNGELTSLEARVPTNVHTTESNWSKSDQVSQKGTFWPLFNRSGSLTTSNFSFISVWVDGALKFSTIFFFFFFLLLLFCYLPTLYRDYTFLSVHIESIVYNPYLSLPAVARFTHRSSIDEQRSYKTQKDKADTTPEKRRGTKREKKNFFLFYIDRAWVTRV